MDHLLTNINQALGDGTLEEGVGIETAVSGSFPYAARYHITKKNILKKRKSAEVEDWNSGRTTCYGMLGKKRSGIRGKNGSGR